MSPPNPAYHVQQCAPGCPCAYPPYPGHYPSPPPNSAYGYPAYAVPITPPDYSDANAAVSSVKHKLFDASTTASNPSNSNKKTRRAKLKWEEDCDNYKELHPKTINRHAADVERLLHELSNGSEGVATDIWVKVLHRRSYEAQEKVALDGKKKGFMFDVINLYESLKKFTHKPKHASTSGTRKKEIQDGINFLSVGAVYDRQEGTTDTFFTDLLGISSDTLHKCEEHAAEIQDDDKFFHRVLGGKHTEAFEKLQSAKIACVQNWQHSYEGSFLNTLSKYAYKVTDPITGKVVSHPQRCWHECGINRAYQKFRLSAEHAKFRLDTGRKICETKFRELLCKCTVDPGENSCVDPIYSQINHYCRAVLNALHFNPEVKEAYANCDCKYCDEAGANGEDLKTELQKRPEDLISSTCCPPEPQPAVRAFNEAFDPKMHKWSCLRGDCPDCTPGTKFQSLRCETLAQMETKVDAKVWKNAPRDSGAVQFELSTEKMSMKDIVKELNLCLGSSRLHFGREKWTSRTRKLHEQCLTIADILIQADFSATVDLRAAEADNSSQDNHAVLLCMTVSYNFRSVEIDIKDDDGNVIRTEVYYTCDTDHWNFWGPSGGKSKKNDHIFYNACKKYVIKYYKDYLAAKNVTLRRVKTWTDNCPGQFGCVQTYRDIAKSDEEFGILQGQYFAEKYCFKSVVDSVGKTTKLYIVRRGEFGGIRSPNAFECCKNCMAAEEKRRGEPVAPGKDYAKFEAERNERLKEKGPLVCKFRHNIYVTDSADEVEERVAGGFPRDKIVLTNRTGCDEVDGCEGSKSFWGFESLRKAFAKLADDKYQIEMVYMPCFCRNCRKLEEIKLWEQENEGDWQGEMPPPCPFQDDIASETLPERPAGLARSAAHYFRKMIGKIKIISHVNIADDALYEFISQMKPNANPTDRDPYIRSAFTLKNLCRSRGQTLGDSKRDSIKKLMQYLQRKNMLPADAQWPQPFVQAPVAAAPAAQAEVALAAIAAANGNLDESEDEEDDDDEDGNGNGAEMVV